MTNMNKQCNKWKQNKNAIMHWNQFWYIFCVWEIWSQTQVSFFFLTHTVYKLWNLYKIVLIQYKEVLFLVCTER